MHKNRKIVVPSFPLLLLVRIHLRRSILPSSGFILIDSAYRPISADPESIKILGFPNAVASPHSLEEVLTQKIRSFLPADISSYQGDILTQFQSGKRCYLCRAFVLENHWEGGHSGKRIALLLERGLLGPPTSAAKQRRLAGVHDDPFSFAPDPKFYNMTRAHREVIASLRNLVHECSGMGVLLGQGGIGKTILLNFLAGSLRNDSEIAFLPGSFEMQDELVRAVMASFGVVCAGKDLAGNLRNFESWLFKQSMAGRRAVLICDDAQNLSFETLEGICRFADLQAGRQKLLQIVFAGRQGLLEKLNTPRLERIAAKMAVFCRLTPLDDAEVRSYVMHRLRVAGCTHQLFSAEALSHIALYSRGVPLNVNMICRHCLSLAATVNLPVIDERIVADSAYDLVLKAQPSSPWDEPRPSSAEQAHHRNRHGLKLIK
jgi:general secretion pathway protein A